MIRSIIHRQLSRNMFGIFNFFNKQASEQQKTYQVLQQQYQNAQNVSQKLDIIKNIINLRSDQEYPSLDTLNNYYKFIVDYQKFHRNQYQIDKETTEAYKQIGQKFSDQLAFEKVQDQIVGESKQEQFDFLKLNQLSFKSDMAINEADYSQFQQILNEMVEILNKQQQEITLLTQLMRVVAGYYQYYFLYLADEKKSAQTNMIDLLNRIRELHSYCLQHTDTLKAQPIEEDKLIEFFYFYDTRILRFLVVNSFDMKEYENCIQYQNELFQLIKSTEGINRFYLSSIHQFHYLASHVNYYRSLQLLEETCSQIERKEDQFALQVRRMEILYLLNQVSKKDIQKLLILESQIDLKDDYQTTFYAVMLLCSAKNQEYSECQIYIDILAKPYEMENKFVDQLMECRYQFYVEIVKNQDNPNVISVYKDIIAYSEIKSSPIYQEVKKRFKEEYFELNKRQQCKLADDMRSVLQDQLQKGIFKDDQNLIRDTLEQTFKIIQSNQNYQYTLLRIFLQLKNTPTMTAQVIAQLSEYISLLEEDQKQ